MGRKEKTDCELVYPPGNSQEKKKKKKSPRKLPCREGERGAQFYSLVSNRRQEKKIILQISSPLSTGLFSPRCKHRGRGPCVLLQRQGLVN